MRARRARRTGTVARAGVDRMRAAVVAGDHRHPVSFTGAVRRCARRLRCSQEEEEEEEERRRRKRRKMRPTIAQAHIV